MSFQGGCGRQLSRQLESPSSISRPPSRPTKGGQSNRGGPSHTLEADRSRTYLGRQRSDDHLRGQGPLDVFFGVSGGVLHCGSLDLPRRGCGCVQLGNALFHILDVPVALVDTRIPAGTARHLHRAVDALRVKDMTTHQRLVLRAGKQIQAEAAIKGVSLLSWWRLLLLPSPLLLLLLRLLLLLHSPLLLLLPRLLLLLLLPPTPLGRPRLEAVDCCCSFCCC